MLRCHPVFRVGEFFSHHFRNTSQHLWLPEDWTHPYQLWPKTALLGDFGTRKRCRGASSARLYARTTIVLAGGPGCQSSHSTTKGSMHLVFPHASSHGSLILLWHHVARCQGKCHCFYRHCRTDSPFLQHLASSRDCQSEYILCVADLCQLLSWWCSFLLLH